MTVSRSQPMSESPLTPEERSDLDGVLIAHLKAKLAEARAELASARKALEGIAARVPKKNPLWLRIVCPVCNWKSIEPHTEARHAPNCAGEVARAALGQPK